MVARNTDAEARRHRRSDGAIRSFLVWWQHLLTAVLGRSASRADSTRRAAVTPKRSPRESFALTSSPLAWTGGVAVLIGAVGTVAFSGTGQYRSVAVTAAVMTLVWAGARWALMDVVSRHRTTLTRAQVRGAWGLGALVWVIGVTPELRTLAWAASGAVTWLALERLGATRRQVLACVGIAWGAQALVVIGSWLARNAIIAILATRG